MRHRSKGAVLLLAALMASCGYFMAGTWEDDSSNWDRAFGSTKPADVVVTHSKYWRSAHWSNEFGYFFELAPNGTLKEQLFTKNKLKRVSGEEAATAKRNTLSDGPDWFAPQSADAYEIWVSVAAPKSNFMVLIDRASGTMFLTDYQL